MKQETKLPKVENKYVDTYKNTLDYQSTSTKQSQLFTQKELNLIKQRAFDKGRIQGLLFASIMYIISVLIILFLI